jgi:small subunit ribosomal protein S9
MTDEPQNPENEQTPDGEDAALAEHRAVPTADAAEIAGSAEDAALEAFEEAQPAAAQTEAEPAAQSAQDAPAAAEAPVAPEAAAAQPAAAEAAAPAPATGAPGVAEAVAQESSEPVGEEAASAPASEVAAEADAEDEDFEDDEEEPAPRVKPAVPGAHLEVDIVPEGVDPLGRDVVEDPYAIEDDAPRGEAEDEDKALPEPISTAAIDLAAGARYRATGKRKTAIARVILRPGSGSYTINGRTLDAYFPRATLQRNIRQPLETVGYEERMDVVARLHGGGVSAQAGALRHGISRALLEADPNLRGELKRRGFLTRDSRAKERKKAGLKKARKRPQFSKR